MYHAESISDVQQFVRDRSHVVATGAGTKSALSRHANLGVGKLSGVLQYQPSEYTFTALAGTPVRAVQQQLAANRQYLPFDPPLVDSGATLGGTVAAGLSGPGRSQPRTREPVRTWPVARAFPSDGCKLTTVTPAQSDASEP